LAQGHHLTLWVIHVPHHDCWELVGLLLMTGGLLRVWYKWIGHYIHCWRTLLYCATHEGLSDHSGTRGNRPGNENATLMFLRWIWTYI
jgi:hypothetical protein